MLMGYSPQKNEKGVLRDVIQLHTSATRSSLAHENYDNGGMTT